MKKAFIAILIFFGVLLNVKAATNDIKPPTVKTFSLSEGEYVSGQQINVNMSTYDDVSGVKNVSVGFRGATSDSFNEIYFFADVYNGKIIVPSNVKPGKYVLVHVFVEDNAGNSAYYNSDICSIIGCSVNEYVNNGNIQWGNITTNIKPSGTDITPPTMHSININKNKFNANENILVTLDASDDISGIQKAYLLLQSENQTGGEYKYFKYDKNSKKYIASFSAPSVSGQYKIYSVEIVDNNQNIAYIDKINTKYITGNKYEPITFNVTGGVVDKENPILTSIKFSNTKVEAPFIMGITAKVKDDASGVTQVNVNIKKVGSNQNNYIVYGLPLICNSGIDGDSNQTCYADYELTQYLESGEYIISSLTVYDASGRTTNYSTEPKEGEKALEKVAFNITNANKYDLITSTINENIIADIKRTKDNALISIDAQQNSIISSKIFEVIKGTNKTINIESDGVIWTFNGKDINDIKDVDVSVKINMLHEDGLKDLYKNILDKAVVINFASNGKLPGKALIKIKANYTLKKYLGEENLTIYYYNPEESNFDIVYKKLEISDSGYYEFYIDHNSTFVISNKTIDNKYVSDNKSNLELNEKKEKALIKNNNVKNNISTIAYIMGVAVLIMIGVIVIIIFKRRKIKKQKNS